MRRACRTPLLPVALLATSMLVASACWRAPDRAPAFQVDRTSPPLGADTEPLLLNDSVTIYFSSPVQPLSVTEDSVTVLDDAGRQVRGALRVSANWVTFEPEPPLAGDLGDGSFRPGATYRLQIAGSPRPDAVRSADGRRLAEPRLWQFRIADSAPFLRSPAPEVPFLLRTPEVQQLLPSAAPRLRLHFTQPILPTTVSPAAVTIRLLRDLAELRPRAMRVTTTPRLDPYPGCTLEIDLGPRPQRRDGTTMLLEEGDYLSIELAAGAAALTDYAGVPPLPGSVQWWSVVEGGSLPLAEWPSGERAYLADDPLLPGFECRGGVIRPRVRVEAGDGSLGVFRPTRDTLLVPGEPFDRGDGTRVQSHGSDFPFTAIDVPEGVTVTIDAVAAGPVRILSCGGVRIAGALLLREDPVPLRVPTFETPAAELLANATIALLAAGDLEVAGAIRTEREVPPDRSPLTLLAAGRMRLRGELPFRTLLAIEPAALDARPAIEGVRGQSEVVHASFTFGVAPSADFRVAGATPWRRLPAERDRGTVRLVEPVGPLVVAWQTAPPDPLAEEEPDRRVDRQSQPVPVLDGDTLATAAGAFVRFVFEARVRPGEPLPTLREVRLEDR